MPHAINVYLRVITKSKPLVCLRTTDGHIHSKYGHSKCFIGSILATVVKYCEGHCDGDYLAYESSKTTAQKKSAYRANDRVKVSAIRVSRIHSCIVRLGYPFILRGSGQNGTV